MSNVETAYTFFLNNGFTSAQSAGIVGNLIQESGVNPESVQQDGPGRGIAQWSLGGRWIPSLATGNPSTDLANQEQYILDELQSNPSYGLNQLKQAATASQAAQIFGTDYERYGVEGARVQDAQQVYQSAQTNDWPTASSGTISLDSANASLTSTSGDIWGAFKAVTGLSGFSSSGLTDVGKIGEEIASGLGFAAKKEPQNLVGNSFLGSMDELLNPSVSLLNPFGIVTMVMARGGVAIFGAAMIVAGLAIITMSIQTGREAVGVAKDAALL